MRFIYQDKTYQGDIRGSCAFYIKQNSRRGIKIWFKSKSKDLISLKKSYAWKNAKKEFSILKKLASSGLSPLPFDLVVVQSPDSQYLYPAIIMEHIESKTLSDCFYHWPSQIYKFNEELYDAHSLSDELDNYLKDLGIKHNDLHFGNILIAKKGIKIIDFNLSKNIA